MASINNVIFAPFTTSEVTSQISSTKTLLCDKYSYTADENLMNCYAVLDSSGTLSTNSVEIYLKTADLVDTIASTVVASATSNRVFFSVDISDLPADDYILQAYFSTTLHVPISTKSFNFTKTADSLTPIAFPGGVFTVDIFPQTQTDLDDVTYPTHATIPIPRGSLSAAAVATLGLFEDDIQISASFDVIQTWDNPATKDSASLTVTNQPKWIHVWFNATWVGGVCKSYTVTAASPSSPSSGLTVTDTGIPRAFTIDVATNTLSTNITKIVNIGHPQDLGMSSHPPVAASVSGNVCTLAHGWASGQKVRLSQPGTPGNLTNGNYYYIGVLTYNTFTLHLTKADAVSGSNIIVLGAASTLYFVGIYPHAVTVPATVTTSTYPVTYPQLDSSKIYYLIPQNAISGQTASYKMYPTYSDAIAETNPIVFYSFSTTLQLRITSPKVLLIEITNSTSKLFTRISYAESAAHGLSDGQAVRIGNFEGTVPTGLDVDTIYYVKTDILGPQVLTLYATYADAIAGSSPLTVPNTGLNYLICVDFITVSNGFISAEFTRPFNGINKLYYDSTGTGAYGSTTLIDSTVSPSTAGLYMKDDRELDWSARYDFFSSVYVEHQTATDICIRSDGWIQTSKKSVLPIVRHATRFNIAHKAAAENAASMIKCQVAAIIADTNNSLQELTFNIPVKNSYHYDLGIDGSTHSETPFTITNVDLSIVSPATTANSILTTNTAHGWTTGQKVIFYSSGSLPTGLTTGVTYYAEVLSTTTFKVRSGSSSGSFVIFSSQGGGVIKAMSGDTIYAYQNKHDEVAVTGAITTSGSKSDGWFVANQLTGGTRTAVLVKNIWQKYPKEISLSKDNIGVHLWPKNGIRNFSVSEETALTDIFKYNCLHQHKALKTDIPSDYYQPWSDQTDTVTTLPENIMAANAQGVSMNNEFAIVFTPNSISFDAANWAKVYQADPIALCADDWNAASGAFLTMAEKGGDFSATEVAIENGIIGWLNPDKVGDYGQFNYGDIHSAYLPSEDRPSLDDVWQNGKNYLTSQLWYLIMRGSSNLMDAARRVTDHYVNVDQTKYDRGIGCFKGDLSLRSGPQYANHTVGGFWHAGGLHWANADYGMNQTIPRHSVWGSEPDGIGLLWAWIIDANRVAKTGFEQWQNAVRLRDTPATNLGANKNGIGVLVSQLLAFDYTHDPSFLPQISGIKTSLNVSNTSFTVTFSGVTATTSSAHGWATGRRVRFSTTGALPATSPVQITTTGIYFIHVTSTTQFTVHTTIEDAYNYSIISGTPVISYLSGGVPTNTVTTGTLLSLTDPLYHPMWISWYYELTRDPAFVQWIKDNSTPLGFALSATTYSITGDDTYLTRHAAELQEQPNLLHSEAASAWNYFGVAPGSNKYFWFTFPFFKKYLRDASISTFNDAELGCYPVAIGLSGDGASASDTILVNTSSSNWNLLMDVSAISGLTAIDVNVTNPSATLLTITFTPPTATSYAVTRDSGLNAYRTSLAVGSISATSVGFLQHVTIRTADAQVFMPISPYPEALLLDDFSNSESPVFRAKKFKGYFVPKTSNDDITLTFTAQGDGGFTKFLIKDDNGDVVDVDSNGDPIAPTSIMYGRFNSVAFVINDSDNTHPTPWYIEATSGLNSYVDLKITSVSLDSTPILFGAVKNDVVSLKFFALGPPVADFHASAISGTPAAAINFVDDSLYVETWSWDFGDGNTSTSQNPSHTYILSGVYTVVLTASSPAGTDSKTRTSYITITDPLSLAPRWGWNGDPLAEIMNRGEGVDITTMTSGIIAISVLNRIPVMIKAPDGSILLITQPLTNFVGDNYSYTVRIKRSTDNGITWSTPYDAYTYLSYVGTSSWLSGGAAVVDYVGVGGQPTSITYFMENGDSTLNHHTILAIRSIDNGLTWTNIAGTPNAATDITSSVNGGFATQAVSSVNTTANTITLTAAHGFADVQAIRFTGSVPGGLTTTRTYFARVTSFASDTFAVYPTGPDAAAPSNIIDITTTGGTFTVKKEWSWNVQTGQGIQLSSNCTHANRLIVPGDHRTIGFDASATGTGVSTSHCIYSDDGGLTWGVLGSLVTSSTNEATIIETTTANKLLMNVRFAGNTTRYQAFSTDGGATWGAATSVAAMQQVSTWASLQRLGSTLILSTPYDTSLATRKQMSIFVSSDEGVTWALQRTIFYRLSAYSSIVPLDDEHGLIVFENGISNHSATIANDNGSYTTSYSTLPWQSMSLFAFNKTWLMGTPDIYAQYYFNSDSTGLANPYGASIIDYGGILNARGFVKSATNTPSYDANGITLSSANDDAIVLTEFSDFNTTASQSITVQVEATIVTSSNGVLASNMTGGTAVGMRLECASGVLKATVYDGSTSTVATGATTINDGVRRVYAMVRNKTTGKLTVYIDGVADSSVVTDSSNSLVTTNGFYLGMNPSGTAQAISAEFHSCRINKSAVATVDLAVSPVTKVTPHTFRNYTAPTPPAFLPSDLSGLETWLNATVDGGESAYADEGWSLTYPLPYYSGARIQSYRDKSPNRYFFNASDYGHNFYQTDTVIGPHIKHQWNAAANAATRWRLQKAPNSTYTFIAGAGPNGNANFAVGMALKINGVSTGPHILLDTQNATSSNSGFLFYIDQTTQKPSFNLGGSTGNYSYIFTSCPAVNNGNWWYLLFVGRGYGSPVDLYYTQYSGTYNPASPNLPAALTKLQSGNVTTPTNTIPAYYLSIGARYDGGSGSNISLKNLVIYSNSTQFSTTDTINATKLANFNVQA